MQKRLSRVHRVGRLRLATESSCAPPTKRCAPASALLMAHHHPCQAPWANRRSAQALPYNVKPGKPARLAGPCARDVGPFRKKITKEIENTSQLNRESLSCRARRSNDPSCQTPRRVSRCHCRLPALRWPPPCWAPALPPSPRIPWYSAIP